MAILNFMVFFPGKEKKPTYFVEKICKGLIANNIVKWDNDIIKYSVWNYYLQSSIYFSKKTKPKIHTIREDKKNRWKPGMMIDFFINARTKNMLRFAPRVKVVSVQKIEIEWYFENQVVQIFIDNERMFSYDIKYPEDLSTKFKHFVQNDGFSTIEDFLDYFNKDFSGKIIHWTDLKY